MFHQHARQRNHYTKSFACLIRMKAIANVMVNNLCCLFTVINLDLLLDLNRFRAWYHLINYYVQGVQLMRRFFLIEEIYRGFPLAIEARFLSSFGFKLRI